MSGRPPRTGTVAAAIVRTPVAVPALPPTCDRCRHFHERLAECRRFPRSLTSPGGWSYPIQQADDWCGEFNARDAR